MHVDALLVLLLIGAIAGFLAGVIFKGYGFGVVGNIVIGIVGAFVGAHCCRGSVCSRVPTSSDKSSRRPSARWHFSS